MLGEIVIYSDADMEELPALVIGDPGVGEMVDLLIFKRTGDHRTWNVKRGDGPGEYRLRGEVEAKKPEKLLIIVRGVDQEIPSHVEAEMPDADTVIAIDPTTHERIRMPKGLEALVIRLPRPNGMTYAESLANCLGSQRMNAAGLTKTLLADWFDHAMKGEEP